MLRRDRYQEAPFFDDIFNANLLSARIFGHSWATHTDNVTSILELETSEAPFLDDIFHCDRVAACLWPPIY